jgi:transposase
MLKLEQMTEQAFNKNMADLQKAQEKLQGDLMTKMEDIRTKRDIAAGEQLTKEATTDKDAKLLTAIAKKKDADTKEKELTSKLSGQIKEGI